MSDRGQEQEGTQSEIDAQVEDFFHVWFIMRQMVMGTNFNRAHKEGMSATQFLVLGLVEEAGIDEPATIGWIANRLNLDPATVVRTVDSLEKRGLLTRRRDTKDRRQVFLELTEEGHTVQKSSHQDFTARLSGIFRNMSAEGREALLSGLREFITVGQKHENA